MKYSICITSDKERSNVHDHPKMIALGFCTVFVLALIVFPVSATESLPVAAFTASSTTDTIPFTVTFLDASTNSPTTWSWTFGDGSTSIEENPSHTYTAAGTYTVSLTATNAAGSHTVTKTDYIQASKVSAPVASFSSDVTAGTEPLTVSFTDSSTNSPAKWVWTFGDNDYSSATNPSHTYTAEGIYTVTLTVTNSGGSDTVTKTGYITVSAVSVPVASFTSNVTTGSIPLTVGFTDASTNTPTAWSWSFGDGSTSTEENPSHTYTAAGTYAVTLTATNYGGGNSVTSTGYITATAAIDPVASFTSNVTTGSIPMSVGFTDTSTNSPTEWTWTFGDGDYSYAENPSHEYTEAGTYTVTLTVTNDAGSDTVTETSYITVASVPVAAFSAGVTSGTVPLTVTFTDSSTNSPLTWTWAFGDGYFSYTQNPSHTYTTAGQYSVALTVTNDAGTNVVTKTQYIIVNAAETPVATTIPTTITITTQRTTAVVTTVPVTTIGQTAATATEGDALWSVPVLAVIALFLTGAVIVSYVIRRRQQARRWEL